MAEMTLPSLSQLPASISSLQTRVKDAEQSIANLQSAQDKLKSDRFESQNNSTKQASVDKAHAAVIDTLSVRVNMVESRVTRLESAPPVAVISKQVAAPAANTGLPVRVCH